MTVSLPYPERETYAAIDPNDPRVLEATEIHLPERDFSRWESLKIALLDLDGPTRRVEAIEGRPAVTLVPENQRCLRLLGLDYPADALTMVGYVRLSHLQGCVDTVLAENLPGDLIETGVWRGGAAILMRAVLGTDKRRVWAADSFEGFAKRELTSMSIGPLADYFAVSIGEVQDAFARCEVSTKRVRFLQGRFADTLPALHDEQWSLVRLDGDSYDATRVGLACLYSNLSHGGFLIVDDYGSVSGCRRAVDEFRRNNGIDTELERIDWSGVCWRKSN